MRKTLVAFCRIPRKQYDDVNGLSEKLLTDSQIPLLPTHLFYSRHTMRQTRALLLHHIMCQDLLLAEQEELLYKMYERLQRTTDHYMRALTHFYTQDEHASMNNERKKQE